MDWLPFAVSGVSLAVSLATFWLVLVRRGTVKMTAPRMLFFTTDRHWKKQGRSKLVVVSLLYATAKRRLAVEALWAVLEHEGNSYPLHDWFYKDGDVAFPSGLNIGEDGRALYHHFYLPDNSPLYPWKPGGYKLSLFARVAGRANPVLLFAAPQLDLPPAAGNLRDREGFSFNWIPETQAYQAADKPTDFGP